MAETGHSSSSKTLPSAAPTDLSKLSAWLKIVYGAGNFGMATLGNAFGMFAMLFYTDVVGLSSQLVGIALSVGRFVDALTDPLMGQISDRTHTRFGRRRPYVMFGSIFWGLVFVSVWLASPDWPTGAKLAYLLLVDVLLAISLTIVTTPYSALGAELTLDYGERSSVAAYKTAFMLCGNVAGAGLVALVDLINRQMAHVAERTGHILRRLMDIARGLPNAEWSAAAISICIAPVVLMFLSGLIPRERFASRSVRQFSSWQALRATLLNANYRRVIATHVTIGLASSFGWFLIPYLLIYWGRNRSLLMPALAVVALSATGSLPLWTRLGRIVEKSVVLRIACAMSALNCPLSLLLISRSHPHLVFLFAAFAGLSRGAFHTYTASMIADVTDEDELRTGRRREGMYFGVFTFLTKLVGSLGAFWSGFGLALIGYVPNVEQSMGTLWGMRLLFAIPSLSNLAALWFLRHYSLDRYRLQEIHAELAQKNNANDTS